MPPDNSPQTLYRQAILNVLWARHFMPQTELQRIADTLATGNERTLSNSAGPCCHQAHSGPQKLILFDPSRLNHFLVPTTPVADTVDAINRHIGDLGFTIKTSISEDDGTAFFGFCNTKADAMSQLATLLKPPELRYFKCVVRIQIMIQAI